MSVRFDDFVLALSEKAEISFCPFLALSGHFSRARDCPLLDQSGQRWILTCDDLSANDPKQTSAVHCGNGFDADLSPYQSTRWSR
jgi:hypothetical protein